MSRKVRATIVCGDKSIVFEGPQEFVERQVAKYSQSDIEPTSQAQAHIRGEGESTPLIKPDERELVRQKRPRNHLETVAVLAFALTQSGVEEFTDQDIYRAYLRAGVRPPKVVAQAVRDAKNKSDFIGAGALRGTYRLTSHGDRTVRFDLPHRE